MNETDTSAERLSWRKRPDYWAVPLRPSNAQHPYDPEVDYEDASTDRIFWTLDEAVKSMLADGRLASDFEILFREFVENSLRHSQALRIEHHRARQAEYNELEQLAVDDTRIIKAFRGEAEPSELLGLILDYPIVSIELAKLSHPLDFDGYDRLRDIMERHIADVAAERYAGNQSQDVSVDLRDTSAHYKLKTPSYIMVDEAKQYGMEDIFTAPRIPLMTMVRKRPVCRIATPHGQIEVVERAGLLLRWDAPVSDVIPPEVPHRAINIARMAQYVDTLESDDPKQTFLGSVLGDQIMELTGRVEEYLSERPDWLTTTSTSYYAYRVA